MADHVNTYDWDDDALSAASRALKYFSTAAQDHHADEEIDLFPLLQQRGDDELDRLINELGSQHQALSTAWQPVAHWLSSHEAVSSDTRRQILELVRQYRTHVQLENEKLLPCASSNLKEPDISKLGAAMKRRRGL